MIKKASSAIGFLGLAFACQLGLEGCGGGGSDPTGSTPDPFAEPIPPNGDIANPGVAAPNPSQPLFDGAVVRAKSAAPVIGGTLLVTRDGRTIVAADPERDSVFLVDSISRHVTPVSLTPGDEPGRIAEGPDGSLFVALRRGGAVLRIDLSSAQVTHRVPVCGSPRGVAYDAKSASVYVGCRSGLFLTLSAADLSLKRSLELASDLRDIIVRNTDVVVTRFLSAEVMVVADDGSVTSRGTPTPEPGCGDATVAFRALSLPGGKIALAHQVSSDDIVQEDSGGYGVSCGGSLVSRVLTTVDVDTPEDGSHTVSANNSPFERSNVRAPASPMTFASSILPLAAGPLDIAFDVPSGRAAVIAFDESLSNGVSSGPTLKAQNIANALLWLSPWDGISVPSFRAPISAIVAGQPVAVAFDGAGKYIVQSREPATLEFEDGASVSLSQDSHADTGHAMFHMDSGIGISCSSCHPEGGEDGHVWHFSEGLRRTLPLEGGVMDRAPFHWDGTLGDMNALVSEVMVKRMAMQGAPNERQVAALGSFLESLPPPAVAEGLDAAAVARGKASFQRADVACASCHSGPQYTDNRLADVGTGGKFVTPSLLGVGLRSALFHDGCAKSVVERFGACGGTQHGSPELLSANEQADLVVFLRSL